MITIPVDDAVFPRRQPCPCGSGKRFKNCCEGLVRIDPIKVFAAEARQPGTIKGMADALDVEISMRNQAKGMKP